MFDRYYRTEGARYPQQVNVTETRAPTDESVKLLLEMQAEAEKNRVGAFHLASNDFDGVAEVFEMMDPPTIVANVHFKIKGKTHTVTARTYTFSPDWKNEFVESLHKAVADKIAVEVLKGMLANVRLPK